MKLFMAALATETNTFSPIPTGRQNFEETVLAFGDATERAPMFFTAPLHVWRSEAKRICWDVVESLAAVAQPAGVTVKSVYEEYRDRILADLEAAMPVDIVLLSLHGAMVAHGYPDCEGDLLSRVREMVGADIPVGAELDPHAHLTDAMMEHADALVFFKEFPHTDIEARARDLFRIIKDVAEGRIAPVMRDADCGMMGIYHTPTEPVRGFVDRMFAAEKEEGILSVSFIHGFPWGDHPRAGARVLCIADGDAKLARQVARQFAGEIRNLREQLKIEYPGIEEALDIAANEPTGPVVLADVADNAGGGAPGDSTFLLEAVLERGLGDIAMGIFWDPLAVRMCNEAGVGSRVRIRLGGKVGDASGRPVDLDVQIHEIATDLSQGIGESRINLGTLVWAESNGVHLLINDLRTQTFHPEAFTGIGIDLEKMRMVIVKSTQHFYAGFAPIASRIIYVATPGALNMDFASIPYVYRSRDIWPLTEPA